MCTYVVFLGQEELLGMRCWCYSHTYYTLYLPAFFHYSHPHKSLDLYRILDEQKEKRVEPVPGYINHFFFEHFATPSASWTFHFNSKNHENFHFYKLQGVQTSLKVCNFEMYKWNHEIYKCNFEIYKSNFKIYKCNFEMYKCNFEMYKCNLEIYYCNFWRYIYECNLESLTIFSDIEKNYLRSDLNPVPLSYCKCYYLT